MAGIDWLSALIGGGGQGIGQAGAVIQRERDRGLEESRRAEDLAFKREQLGETKRQFDEGRSTDLEALGQFIPMLAGKTGRVPNAALPLILADMEKQRERADREAGASYLERMGAAQPPQPTGALQPGEDPEAAAFIGATPGRAANERVLGAAGLMRNMKGGVADLAKILFPEPKAPEPFTLGEGQQRFDPSGRVIAAGPAKAPKDPTEGDKRRGEIDSYLQNVRKLTPGTPQYEKEFMDWRNRPLTIFPGGEAFKMTDVQGAGPAASVPGAAPQPTLKGGPNPPIVSTEQTVSLADFRTLLGQFDKIEDLYAKGASKYVGPVQGTLGALKGVTGIGATEGEADFRAELASIQNSLIYLKSGKQINEQEYARLQRELPDPMDPDTVFVAKMRRAKGLAMQMLANRESEFKSRGYRGAAPSAPLSPQDMNLIEKGNDPLGIRR